MIDFNATLGNPAGPDRGEKNVPGDLRALAKPKRTPETARVNKE